MSLFIDTPCIGICSTVYGDIICRGCKRNYQEVINWNALINNEKNKIYERLDFLITQTTKIFLLFPDDKLIKESLSYYKIRYIPSNSPYTLAYYLLRGANKEITQGRAHGLHVKNKYKEFSMPKLFSEMDSCLFILSTTFYEKSLCSLL